MVAMAVSEQRGPDAQGDTRNGWDSPSLRGREDADIAAAGRAGTAATGRQGAWAASGGESGLLLNFALK